MMHDRAISVLHCVDAIASNDVHEGSEPATAPSHFGTEYSRSTDYAEPKSVSSFRKANVKRKRTPQDAGDDELVECASKLLREAGRNEGSSTEFK